MLWLKNCNAEKLKIEYQQRGIKLKCSMDKKLYFLKDYFLPLNQKNLIRKYFDLPLITSQNKTSLINIYK